MSEKIYDDEIAPKLKEAGELCVKHGIPFLAVVEWEQGKIGRTDYQTKDECLEMIMIRHCAKTAPNIDGYIIGLVRWAKKHGVDFSRSFVMKTWFQGEEVRDGKIKAVSVLR
jgi:hypothetical protein